MEKTSKFTFTLTEEDKTLLTNTLHMLETIAVAMDNVDSYYDVIVENDKDIDDEHDFGDCVDEIYDHAKTICNFLSHQTW